MGLPAVTAWKIVGLEGREGLNFELAVNTTAPAVVDAIEDAAEAHGIELERFLEVRGDRPVGE